MNLFNKLKKKKEKKRKETGQRKGKEKERSANLTVRVSQTHGRVPVEHFSLNSFSIGTFRNRLSDVINKQSITQHHYIMTPS